MDRSRLGTLLAVLAALIIGGILVWYFLRNSRIQENTRIQDRAREQQQQDRNQQDRNQQKQFSPQTFQNNRTQNFVSSQPSNNQVLNSNVNQVVITFNKDLDRQKSQANVTNTANNNNVTSGNVTVSNDTRSLIVPVRITETGNYQVNYTACFTGDDCFNGSFGFSANLQNQSQ